MAPRSCSTSVWRESIEACGRRARLPPGAPLGFTHFYAQPGAASGRACDRRRRYLFAGRAALGTAAAVCAGAEADLQSIVTRAAASDPAERYESVDALRSDIERWLDGLPVRAHGSHWAYIASRFVARHRAAVAGAAAGVLVLTGAVVALSILYVREQRATLPRRAAIQRCERAVPLRAVRCVRSAGSRFRGR